MSHGNLQFSGKSLGMHRNGYSSSFDTSLIPTNKVMVQKLNTIPSQKLAKESISSGIKNIAKKQNNVVTKVVQKVNA